jgi:hypothetical protein
MQKDIGGNLASIIAGVVLIFIGFLPIIILYSQANALTIVAGKTVVPNWGLFFGVTFLALISVLLGGFIIGKYLEKQRNEKHFNAIPPPP